MIVTAEIDCGFTAMGGSGVSGLRMERVAPSTDEGGGDDDLPLPDSSGGKLPAAEREMPPALGLSGAEGLRVRPGLCGRSKAEASVALPELRGLKSPFKFCPRARGTDGREAMARGR